jgi:SAM-dependent methyltransferase
MLKLNLGCGHHRMPGFLNVDAAAACNPDRLVDLEDIPWPWESDSVDAVLFNHSLEHMCAATEKFLAMMRELYRVCCHEAVIQIGVPHPRHDDFLDDPTHVRAITPAMLMLFDRRKNDEWRAGRFSNTPLAHYLDVDFELTHWDVVLAQPYPSMLQRGEITREQLDIDVRTKNNVAKEYRMSLRVRKQASDAAQRTP